MTTPEARPARRPQRRWGPSKGFEVAALLLALLVTVAVVDVLLSDRLGLLFDLTFITLCCWAAATVRPADFYTVAVLPPVAMLVVVVLLAVGQRGSVARSGDGLVQATVTGLTGHSVALAAGFVLCLAVLGARRRLTAA